MVLCSASLAPYLAHEPIRRSAAAYCLVQVYALSVTPWAQDDRPDDRLLLTA